MLYQRSWAIARAEPGPGSCTLLEMLKARGISACCLAGRFYQFFSDGTFVHSAITYSDSLTRTDLF